VVAAVDRQLGGGDEAGFVAQQEGDRRRDLLDVPQTSQHVELAPHGLPLGTVSPAAFSTSRVQIQPGLTVFTRML
jgi:hypothetical protein